MTRRRPGIPAASFFAGRSVHDVAPLILDSELGGRVAGYTYPEYCAARGLADSQETRRAWRLGR